MSPLAGQAQRDASTKATKSDSIDRLPQLIILDLHIALILKGILNQSNKLLNFNISKSSRETVTKNLLQELVFALSLFKQHF